MFYYVDLSDPFPVLIHFDILHPVKKGQMYGDLKLSFVNPLIKKSEYTAPYYKTQSQESSGIQTRSSPF